MDALIRAARIAPSRARLSETLPASVAPPAVDELQNLRVEITNQVRAELTAELRQSLDVEYERARQEGHAAGLIEGREAAARERDQERERAKHQVESALLALIDAHRQAMEQFQLSVGEVSFAAVCRLVGEKATSPAFVLQLVKSLCAEIRSDAVAVVRLHPRDIETLGELANDGELRIDALGLKITADPSLQLGGCVVETSAGCYDGSLDIQLRRLHAALSGGRE